MKYYDGINLIINHMGDIYRKDLLEGVIKEIEDELGREVPNKDEIYSHLSTVSPIEKEEYATYGLDLVTLGNVYYATIKGYVVENQTDDYSYHEYVKALYTEKEQLFEYLSDINQSLFTTSKYKLHGLPNTSTMTVMYNTNKQRIEVVTMVTLKFMELVERIAK